MISNGQLFLKHNLNIYFGNLNNDKAIFKPEIMICCQNEDEINGFINGLANKQMNINSILQQTKRIDNNNPYIGSYNNTNIKVIIINQQNYTINPKQESFQQQSQKHAYQGDGINTNVILQQMQNPKLNEQNSNNYMGENVKYIQNNHPQSIGLIQAQPPTQINREIRDEIKCILYVLIDFIRMEKKIKIPLNKNTGYDKYYLINNEWMNKYLQYYNLASLYNNQTILQTLDDIINNNNNLNALSNDEIIENAK